MNHPKLIDLILDNNMQPNEVKLLFNYIDIRTKHELLKDFEEAKFKKEWIKEVSK